MDSGQLRLGPFAEADFDLSTAPKEELQAANPLTQPIVLTPAMATLKKATETFGDGTVDEQAKLNNWNNNDDVAVWSVDVDQPGAYEIWFNSSHPGLGSQANVKIGDRVLLLDIPDTKDWDNYQRTLAGKVIIDEPGTIKVTVSPQTIAAGSLMNLQGITLEAATESTTIVSGPQWDFRFPSQELRYVRFVFNEFLGESVAINDVEIGGATSAELYIPTNEDVLALASNATLEIAAGDTVTANYTDEFTQNESGTSQLLNSKTDRNLQQRDNLSDYLCLHTKCWGSGTRDKTQSDACGRWGSHHC